MISKYFAHSSRDRVALQVLTPTSPAPGKITTRDALPRFQLLRHWTARLAKPLFGVASAAVAGTFLVHSFGLQRVAVEASRAQLWPLAGAVVIGAAIQVVRAQRARSLLGHRRPVSLFQSYAAMTVGHGIGDLVPVAPGGPVLRSLLTERLTRIPIAFSSGVFMAEGTLDIVAPAILVPYLLMVVPSPTWVRWVLVGLLVQATLLVAILAVFAVRPRFVSGRRLVPFLAPRVMDLARQAADGFRVVTAGGARRALIVVGLSLLVLALTAGQVTLFLRAFALTESANGLVLLLVIMLSAGSIPIKVPAFGTITAAAALPIAGIHGPNVAGYLLTSQFLLSSETTALAILVLGWWFVRGNGPLGGRNRTAIAPFPELVQARPQSDLIAS